MYVVMFASGKFRPGSRGRWWLDLRCAISVSGAEIKEKDVVAPEEHRDLLENGHPHTNLKYEKKKIR